MTLRELIEPADDLVWFHVVDPTHDHVKIHLFEHADYLVEDKDVMEDVGPIIDRDVQSYSPELISDPDPVDAEIVEKIPCIDVLLKPSKEV